MRIGFKFLIMLLTFLLLILYFVFKIFIQDIKPSSQRATESLLVDTANILAQFAAQDLQDFKAQSPRFQRVFHYLNQNVINAKIYDISKKSVNYRVYITDQQGIVIFDSDPKINSVGEDYSRWNDVYLTLQGKYGARSSRQDTTDSLSTVMYVAAPIKINNEIVGSLTVANPSYEMLVLVNRTERKIKIAGFILLGIILVIGLIFITWLNRSLKQLEKYAGDVAAGKKVRVPRMASSDLQTLADALEKMRVKLEGKSYIEHYVHALTHELKSPIAAVKGAAELLKESPPIEMQQHFLENITQQNERMQLLIDRLLYQAKIESLTAITLKKLDLIRLINNVINEKSLVFNTKTVALSYESILKNCIVEGDELLLQQAISNLLDNALDFSAKGDAVIIKLNAHQDHYEICVMDIGAGIPEYARERIFERFYSLPRPDKAKSTGLGLSFVFEVALLHFGSIRLERNEPKGTIAIIELPKTY